MSRPIISVENLSKAYRLGLKEEVPDTLTSAIKGVARAPFRNLQRLRRLSTTKVEDSDSSEDTLWALKDVSFEVQPGDVVGIIGRNGAGKSTLLKILSRITEPTSGRAVLRGRVSSLLEVGTGFHPELSGRDNVYLNGTILGMSKGEIDRKFDEIVNFSGVEKFLDTPTKRYSSGMQVRLAFAVAAHLEPEILVIDEVLAVGDVEFQAKCLGKMQDVAAGGRTVIFVSHNMACVENLCTRAVLVSGGRVAVDSDVGTAIDRYMQSGADRACPSVDLSSSAIIHGGIGGVRCRAITFYGANGLPASEIRMGESFGITLQVAAQVQSHDVVVGFGIFSSSGVRVAGLNSEHSQRLKMSVEPRCETAVHCQVASPPLAAGRYHVNVQVKSVTGEVLDFVEKALLFEVRPADVYGTGCLAPGKAVIFLRHEWEVKQSQFTEA